MTYYQQTGTESIHNPETALSNECLAHSCLFLMQFGHSFQSQYLPLQFGAPAFTFISMSVNSLDSAVSLCSF